MGEFRMPSLGADMEEGTLLHWLVAPGDTVARGDIVAVVDTEKSDIEVEVFEAGIVKELLVAEGELVPVGTPLARIDPAPAGSGPVHAPGPLDGAGPSHDTVALDGPPRGVPTTAQTAGRVLSPLVRHLADDLHVDVEHLQGSGPGGVVTRHDVEVATTAPPTGAAPAHAPVAPRPAPAPPAASVMPVAPGEPRVPASPRARRLAAAAGIDLDTVVGSGPGGVIVADDLATARPAPTPAAPARPAAPVDRDQQMRDAIARSMSRAKREIPHYYLHTTIDVGAALDWLRDHNESRPVTQRLLPAALLLKATALAAADHPELNGWWEDGHRPADTVHLGVAIALRGGGLVAPGIADADRLSLDDLMVALRDLTGRARAGRVRGSEWTGPTITVTSLGDLGVDAVLGVIHPPQLAMVGFGAVHDAVIAVDGAPAVRPVVVASLAADHRTSDGIAGAAFLARIDRLLQTPDLLAAPRDGAAP